MQNVLEIPNKSHFKLNEVCSLTGVKPYVLRFWESEFDDITSEVSPSGEKIFSAKNIESIVAVKELLFTNKMNIEEAKAKMLRNAIIEPDDDDLSFDGDQDYSVRRATLEENDLVNLARAKELLKEITLYN